MKRFDRTAEEQLRVRDLRVDQGHELVFSRLVAGPGLIERRDKARSQLDEQCLGRRPTVELAVFAEPVEGEDRQDRAPTVGRKNVAEVGEERSAVAEARERAGARVVGAGGGSFRRDGTPRGYLTTGAGAVASPFGVFAAGVCTVGPRRASVDDRGRVREPRCPAGLHGQGRRRLRRSGGSSAGIPRCRGNPRCHGRSGWSQRGRVAPTAIGVSGSIMTAASSSARWNSRG